MKKALAQFGLGKAMAAMTAPLDHVFIPAIATHGKKKSMEAMPIPTGKACVYVNKGTWLTFCLPCYFIVKHIFVRRHSTFLKVYITLN